MSSLVAIAFPAVLKAQIQQIASERGYPCVAEITARGGPDELLLQDLKEAQAIVDVARLQMLDASLRFPFWDEDNPRHDPAHDNAFQDVQMGLFEKTCMYLGQQFQVVTQV